MSIQITRHHAWGLSMARLRCDRCGEISAEAYHAWEPGSPGTTPILHDDLKAALAELNPDWTAHIIRRELRDWCPDCSGSGDRQGKSSRL
jgi:hypothetical protein